jgi:hypothetical protein
MTVQSAPASKSVFQYCSEYLISADETTIWNATARAFDTAHPAFSVASRHYGGRYQPLRVPSFQRGIEWDFTDLEDCITSQSKILGIAVLGRHLAAPQDLYILDGLQRFSAFTFLLHRLSPVLFGTTPSSFTLHASVQSSRELQDLQRASATELSLRGRFEYNFQALHYLTRKLVASTYGDWCRQGDEHLSELLDSRNGKFDVKRSLEFLAALHEFLGKPLFIEELSNFANFTELLSTFKGLNTIRVELTPADVCRSVLIDGVVRGGSPPDQVLAIDNQFNGAILTETGRVKRLLGPAIKVLEDQWLGDTRRTPPTIVPSLFSSPPAHAVIASQFSALTGWIARFDLWRNSSSYVDFIASLGDNPYVATMLYYFHRLHGNTATPPSDVELHQIVTAYLRRLLDGTIGDTLSITKRAGAGGFGSLTDFLREIAPPRAGLSGSPAQSAWLKTQLSGFRSVASARLVFNACLLPKVFGPGAQPFGSLFAPYTFSSGANNWSIDHLIPQNSFPDAEGRRPVPPSSGDGYIDSLSNLCPVLGSDNSSYQSTACSQKLDMSAAYYASYRTGPDARKRPGGLLHPFIDRVLSLQGCAGGAPGLDNRDLLAGTIPGGRCYGEERLDVLRDLLLDRI